MMRLFRLPARTLKRSLAPLVAAAIAVMALAMPAAAEKIPLQDISDYLNSLKTAQAKFTQINDDGSISTGELDIKRPGRMRFQYDAPNNAKVLVNAGTVAVYDPKASGGPSIYPLSMTPLNLILGRNIDLNRAKMVIGYGEQGAATVVRAQDPDHPDYGTIDLMFTGDPVQLRQWVITDQSGSKTTVTLGQMKTGMSLGDSLFHIDRS